MSYLSNHEHTINKLTNITDRDYNLWWLILQTRRAMHKVRARELFEYGISPEEAGALFAIRIIGHRATPAKISRLIFRAPHTISDLVNRMQKKGLLRKIKDLDKKNQVRVEMTEKGRQSYDDSANRESIHRILSVLSDNERHQLVSCLERLRNKAIEELGIVEKPAFPPIG